MKPHCVCVIWLLLDIQDVFSSICLTWNTTGNYLNVKCSVQFEKQDILIDDPYGHNRVHCIFGDSVRCSTSNNFDQVLQENLENFKTLTLKTNKYNAEGKWTCRHGNQEATSKISYSEGIRSNVDVTITGKFKKMHESNTFTVECSSCWKTLYKGAAILVNNVLEDSIRYLNGKCYHKLGACSPVRCTCSASGNNFTWIINSNLPYVQFTCDMRFWDEIKYRMYRYQTGFVYNGSVTIQTYGPITNSTVYHAYPKTNYTINEDNINGKNIEQSYVEYLVLINVAVIMIVVLITFTVRIHVLKRKQTLEEGKSTRKKQGQSYDRDMMTLSPVTPFIDRADDESEMTLNKSTSHRVKRILTN